MKAVNAKGLHPHYAHPDPDRSHLPNLLWWLERITPPHPYDPIFWTKLTALRSLRRPANLRRKALRRQRRRA